MVGSRNEDGLGGRRHVVEAGRVFAGAGDGRGVATGLDDEAEFLAKPSGIGNEVDLAHAARPRHRVGPDELERALGAQAFGERFATGLGWRRFRTWQVSARGGVREAAW